MVIPAAAAATFLAAFGAAELTGVRAVGGVVLVGGGAWCVRGAWQLAGPAAAGALASLALALFVASHPLGRAIGPWPAVSASAAALAAATAGVLGRPSLSSR